MAYEGFAYSSGSSVVGQNGGTSWLNAWQLNGSGSGSVYTNATGSLSYTDALGNSLVTSSNSAFFGGSPSANNTAQPNRDMLVTRTNGTTWLSFLGVRQGLTTNTIPGNPYPRGANLGLFNGTSQRLAIGNGSGAAANVWSILPLGMTGFIQYSTKPFDQVSLVVVRIDHLGTTSDPDNAYIWINPTLGVEPNTNAADISSIGVNDYSFNRFRPFAGGYDTAGGQPNAQMRLDEIRVGDTYADVTPYVGTPQILVNPTNVVAARCGTAVFSVTAVGTQPLNYFWFFNSALTNTSGATLTLTNVGPAQAGSYFLIVSNSSGTATSSVVSLTVVDTTPPTIAQCASNRLVAANGSCQATIPNLTASVVASDCSGIATITQNPLAGTLVGAGPHTVTISVTDTSNNVAQCTAVVTVADPLSPPTITGCAPNQSINTAPNQQASIPDLTGLVVISNHCNAAAVTQSPTAGTMVGPGNTLVSLTATTDGTNSTFCNATVSVNGLPVATNQAVSMLTGAALDITLSAGDYEHSPLTFLITSNPTNGVLGTLTSNHVTYTPNLNYVGNDAFNFAASDGQGTSAVATVSISVTDLTYPPSWVITKDGTTVLLQNYASAPLSSRTTGTYNPTNINFTDQLARLNFLRSEPANASLSSTRFVVCDNNRYLYFLNRTNQTFTTYINFEEVFPKFDNDPGFAGGLVSFQFDPGYATNGIFYTVHTEDPAKAGSAVPTNGALPGFNVTGYTVTTAVNPPVGGVTRQSVLIEWTDTNVNNSTFEGTAREILRVGFSSNIHPMGDLLFNPLAQPGSSDYRNLYISDGDGGAGESSSTRTIPQRLDAIQGKILRITPDLSLRPADELSANGRYRIPTTGPDPNPFISVSLTNLKKEIFAYGFRNCHRITWDPVSNLLIEDDIGLHSWEEVNIIHKGANYGYSEREGPEQLFVGGANDGDTGGQTSPLTPFPTPDSLTVTGIVGSVTPNYPVAAYSHRDGDAISSGFVYRGSLMPQLYGKYIFGEITTGRILYADLAEMIAADDGTRTTMATIHEIQVVFDSPYDSPDQGIVNRRLFDIESETYTNKGGNPGTQKLTGSAAATTGTDIDLVPYGRGRADIRLAQASDGELYVLSKSDGMIRRLLPPPAPNIISVTASNGNVSLTWRAIPSHIYRVQYKDSVTGGAWTNVAGDVTANGQTASKALIPVAGVTRFYRVIGVW